MELMKNEDKKSLLACGKCKDDECRGCDKDVCEDCGFAVEECVCDLDEEDEKEG